MKGKSARLRRGEGTDYLYRQLADRLRDEIASGVFAPGSRLPSLDQIASTHQVNRLTARKAIGELRTEGRVYSVPAQGTYVGRAAGDAGAAAARTPVIGLLSHVLHPSGYGLYPQTMIAGLYDELARTDANLLVMAAGVVEQDEIPAMMRGADASAMIYLGHFDRRVLAEMVAQGPPAVLLDAGACGLPCDSVCVDNASGAREAVRHLLAQGHGDALAIIAGASGDRATTERLKGAKEAFAEANLDFNRTRVVTGGYRRQGGVAAMRDLLASGRRPKAVFCMNDEMAAGAIETMRGAGLRAPDDIAVMGFDDSMWAEAADPPLTTMRVDARQMGRLAMRMLQARVADPSAAPTATTLQPQLVRRASA